MNLISLFNKRENLVAFDIGSGAIKMVEIEGSAAQPIVSSFAVEPLESEVFSNYIVSKPEVIADIVTKICENHEIEGKRAIVSVPAPAVFTKRIKMPAQDEEELRSSVQFEAGNFIPHKIDAVKLDFAVLGDAGKNQLDILVVAVKSELLNALEDCLGLAGLECAMADVDFFALHNLSEFNKTVTSEGSDKITTAILNIGYRYTSLIISRDGLPLFVGDMAIGLKQLEEELTLKLQIPEKDCAAALRSLKFNTEWDVVVNAFVEQSAQEITRQISFFWNTCGVEGNINKIFVTGGGSLIPKLIESIGHKSGIDTASLDPFSKIAIAEQVDKNYLNKMAPFLTVALGLGLRTPGDGQRL